MSELEAQAAALREALEQAEAGRWRALVERNAALARAEKAEADNRLVDDDCLQYARKLEKRAEGDRNVIDQLREDLNACALERDAALARAEKAEAQAAAMREARDKYHELAAEMEQRAHAAEDRADELRAARDEARVVLMRVEWVRGSGLRFCEVCDALEPKAHAPGCALAKALGVHHVMP
jgi:hypothetical protein